ncbi:MAG: 16S rRNA (cytosine(1402)-N(4))-methyltransferase RsmH [Candidatus Pacebacteria bacterium]|nr:16S rRNA (cytosine(1402)-N(4))-methyltransferase RsmH [Candidatus Paceibacterota bacterium]
MSYFHIPVLLKETIEIINPKPGENLIDGTLGGGGHSEAILEKTLPDGKLLGIDLDDEALQESERRLEKYASGCHSSAETMAPSVSSKIILRKGNFADFVEIKEKSNFGSFNIFFLDLGISSQQLNNKTLGISFLKNLPLDMRMGGADCKKDNYKTAEHILNNWNEDAIRLILKNYGEERYAKNIAREIVKERKVNKIIKTEQLVKIISEATPAKYKNQRIHFATRTFQALRIEVNDELKNLENVLPQILENIEIGGRIAVISFHSLEDRIVKQFFQKESKDCICGPEVPVCVCGHQKRLEIITKKPIVASEKEILKNPRARSGKLRVAKKIE